MNEETQLIDSAPAKNKETNQAKDTSVYFLSENFERLPPAYTLTRKHVVSLALRLAATHANQTQETYFSKGKYYSDTNVYGIRIESKTKNGVSAKAGCAKFWRTSLENKVNLDRINYEAMHRLIGGPIREHAENYSSNATVERMREKTEASNLALSKLAVKNTITGKESSMLSIANASFSNRFNELYSFTKNFEAMAKENGMDWLFVTFTAPPEYHPNPSSPNSKCSYKPELGVKASHTYINRAWTLIRAMLSKWGIRASPTSYFGARTVEVHKDGCIHWHLLIFINDSLINNFTKACKEKFSLPGQLKIVLGDDNKGSASTYIFKYLMKEFDINTLDRNITDRLTKSDKEKDREREEMDLASIENSERIRAAIRAMSIRQYQTIGLLRVTTLLRKINKLDLSEIIDTDNNVLGFIQKHVWRNPMGLKNLLEKPHIFSRSDDEPPSIKLIKEQALSRYGEERERVIGIEIDGREFISKGLFQIIKKQ
ncbi:replication endonuclease [Pseudomonas sp. xss_4]|uniref:replication endonuclease n=1 Tax=Pseudomonas sp. xss_4 TaxID=3367216 RepID=UPI00370AF61C